MGIRVVFEARKPEESAHATGLITSESTRRRDATRREPTIRADATARHPLCIEHHFSPSFIHPFTDYTGRYPRFDELFASRVYFAVTGEQPASRGLLRKTSL